MKKFIIIDGNALVHRAWHALPQTMMKKDGTIVNAVYGFISILLKSMQDLKPDYIAVTFDMAGPTFRHEKYVEYKATRERKEDALYEQIPIIKEVLDAFNIKYYEKAGFEADDLIGTLCEKKQIDRDDIMSVIVTGDKDTLQLIDDNTQVYTLQRGFTDTIIFNEKEVMRKFNGLKPVQMIDYKALRGDPSDNIPGVKGIGEKTAIQLLTDFKTLENLYQEIEKKSKKAQEKIKDRIRNLLIEKKQDALMSKDLVTIEREVEFGFHLDDCKIQNYNQEKLISLFSELEFKSLLARLPKQEVVSFEKEEISQPTLDFSLPQVKTVHYNLIDSQILFEDFFEKLNKQKIFTFDTETTGLDVFNTKLLGISFCWNEGTAYYVVIDDKRLQRLKEVFEDEKIQKVAQNMKFDASILKANGIEMKNFYFDTMIASYVLNPGSRQHSLDRLAFVEFQHQMIPITALIGEKKQLTMDQADVEKVSEYSCEDADYTWRLYLVLKKRLQENDLLKLFEEIEMPLVPVLIEMEFNGIKIDLEQLKKLSKKVGQEIELLTKKIHDLAGQEFNISSPKQLKEILFDKLQISVKGIKSTKTGISTAAAELEKLKDEHEIIPLISDYRELSKLQSTYIEALPKLIHEKTDRVHTSYNQTVTATGRLSSSDPNLQNIPIRTELGREIRKAFIADKGNVIVAADYSQIELRVVACLAEDENMISIFKEDKDIHSATAAKIFEVKLDDVTKDMRRKAKEVNFGVLYGLGSRGLAQRTGITVPEAKEFIEKYYKTYAKVFEYTKKMVEFAKENDYVQTLFGRKRYLPEINSSVQMIRASAERMAVNMPIQGTAADLMKIAMIEVFEELKKISPKSKMLLQVHDELVFEVPKEEVEKVVKVIDEKMEKVHKFCVPVKVDIEVGDNWDEMEHVS